MTTMRELTSEVKRLNKVITELCNEVGVLKNRVAALEAGPYVPNPPDTIPGCAPWNPVMPAPASPPPGPFDPWWERLPRTHDPLPRPLGEPYCSNEWVAR